MATLVRTAFLRFGLVVTGKVGLPASTGSMEFLNLRSVLHQISADGFWVDLGRYRH
ncbi:MAG: hypothetical protein ING75_01905 [Rhodocyclaceae bacterium]|nr:hypothetical protein [Rhodocyclaceae bacterium]